MQGHKRPNKSGTARSCNQTLMFMGLAVAGTNSSMKLLHRFDLLCCNTMRKKFQEARQAADCLFPLLLKGLSVMSASCTKLLVFAAVPCRQAAATMS